MASILGLNVEEMLGRDALSHFTDEVADGVRRRLATRAERGPERYELLYLHPDGSQRTLSVSAAPLPDDAGAVGSLAMVTDITESRRLERELQRSVLHDGLTGLPNRLLALDRLEHALTRETESTAVLFIDLDHLRVLNESRGHDVGDELLVAVAERLRDTAFSFDTVARFGGDAFLVICENVDEMTAQAYAEKLLDNSASCPSRT